MVAGEYAKGANTLGIRILPCAMDTERKRGGRVLLIHEVMML